MASNNKKIDEQAAIDAVRESVDLSPEQEAEFESILQECFDDGYEED